MYRSNRFSRSNEIENTRLLVTACAVAVLAVAVACSSDDNTGRAAAPAASTVPAAQPTTGSTDSGEVVRPVSTQPVDFASAQGAYTKRRYAEATEAFGQYALQHPNNAYGHYMLGLSAWKSGDLEQARAALEHSLVLDSTNVKTLLNLGRVLLEQKQTNEALVHVTAAQQLDSGSSEVQRMMARVQSARGDHDAAMTSYRLALSLDPSDSWSMNNLGLLLIGAGRYEEALPPLARAVELRPEAPAFANNLGVALERTGHPTAAGVAFRAALTADSTYTKASRSLARVDGKADDSAAVDVSVLAAAFNEELQVARRTRLMAKAVVKPDSAKVPER